MNVRFSGGRPRNTPCLAESHPGVQRTQSHTAPFIPGRVVLSRFLTWGSKNARRPVSYLGIEECKETGVYDNLPSGEAKGIDLLRDSGFRA